MRFLTDGGNGTAIAGNGSDAVAIASKAEYEGLRVRRWATSTSKRERRAPTQSLHADKHESDVRPCEVWRPCGAEIDRG